MTQSITTTQWGDPSELEQYAQWSEEGFDSFGEQEFLKPPTIHIAQPTSEHPNKGVFYMSSTDEELGDEINIVMLHLQRSMSFKKGDSYDSPSVCWSRNFWTPDQDVPEKQAHQCHARTSRRPIPVCPMAKWQNQNGERIRPKCEEIWVVAVAILDADMNPQFDRTALMYHRGANVSPLRDYIGQFRTNCRGLPLFGVSLNITLKYNTKKDGYKGNFYVMQYPDVRKGMSEQVKLIPSAHMQTLHEQHLFFKEYMTGPEEAATVQRLPSSHPNPPQLQSPTPSQQAAFPSPATSSVSPPTQNQQASPSGTGWGK
ncbi:MAG TPA: hypothetical protein DCE42_02355 [Myxococcales bacterium]|nr:hypothetical protein [Deltaproteobacteria bacterium]MBK07328.1 hypothetical protein [Deltaproteobacteria bacterium]MBU53254.1 hypothetical protein [Deltaproteobacteria bacterium]HAA53566.1 hypothetical protein [Myxococcales bacterium]|tara:strand:- start:13300 stop:14241 length:942 start_codon:yes stop_codon:yes gene_type:complete